MMEIRPRASLSMKNLAWMAVLFIAGALTDAVYARDQHILWAVKGKQNTVFLLGSVHLLRPSDAQLPAEAEHAFNDSQRLVMEIDMDDVTSSDPLALAGEMEQAAQLPQGQTLRNVLGSDYASINERARKVGVDLEALDGFAPWFVAMNLLELQLAQRGFSPEFGIERTLAARAAQAHKPIEGLETPAQQFQMLASMPLPMQKRFLLMTLDESADIDRELDELVRAWRTGDTATLARVLSSEYREFPDLYQRLTVDRNRAWTERLVQLLNERDDCLVVVGALHLVGKNSVVDLLTRRGYQVTQE